MIRILFSCLGLSFLFPLLPAQPSAQWFSTHKVQPGDYYEGTYTDPVSNPIMELVSLTAQWEPYQFRAQQVQQIRFHSPSALPYQVKAEELNVVDYYWFQYNPANRTDRGVTTWAQWRVDGMLRRLQLGARSLGLVVRLGNPKGREFSPAWVYHSQLNSTPQVYLARIRLGVFTDSGGWELYRGKADERRAANLIQPRKRIPASSGGSCMQLRIPISQLTRKGWYSIKVDIRERGNLDPHVYTFSFYHGA